MFLARQLQHCKTWFEKVRRCIAPHIQGCGKTTLVEELEALFEHEGVRTASVSIDDFYLTFADQQALARVPTPDLTPSKSHPGLQCIQGHWQVHQGVRKRSGS